MSVCGMKKIFLVCLITAMVFTQLLPVAGIVSDDRDQGWKEDVNQVRELFTSIYFKDPKHVPISKEQFNKKCNELIDKVSELDNDSMVFELLRLIALIKDGHANIFYPSKKMYMFMAEYMKDGFYITRSLDTQKSIRRCKLLEIDGKPISDVRKMLEPFISFDSRYSVNISMTSVLYDPKLLNYAGVCDSAEKCTIKLEDTSGKVFSEEMTALEPTDANKMVIDPDYWDKYRNDPPLCYQRKGSYYGFHYIAEKKAVYVFYQKCAEDDQYPVKKMVKELDALWKEKHPEKLIFDIRFNNGGGTAVFYPFLEWVTNNDYFREPGKFFVIIGNRVFSAASQTAAILYLMTDCTFVGEPIGQKPNHWGEVKKVRLGYSKLPMVYSSRFMEIIRDSDPEAIMPDTEIAWSRDDFFNLKDSVLDGILDGKIPEKTRKTCVLEAKQTRWSKDLRLVQASLMLKYPDLSKIVAARGLEKRFDDLISQIKDFDIYDLTLATSSMFKDFNNPSLAVSDASLFHADAIPMIVECKGDELLITKTSSINKDIAGCTLLGIGGVDMPDLSSKFANYFYFGNWNHFLVSNPEMVLNLEMLERLGIKVDPVRIPLKVKTKNGDIQDVVLFNIDIDSFGVTEVPDHSKNDIPLYLRKISSSFIESSKAFYINPFFVNYSTEDAMFSELDKLQSGDIGKVVVDFRSDCRFAEGDFTSDIDFIKKLELHLKKFSGMRVFAIVDRMASPRAVWLSDYMRTYLIASIVGQTPAIKHSQIYVFERTELTYTSLTTDLTIDIPTKKIESETTPESDQLAVDREIVLNPHDYLMGSDPVMDWILAQ